MTVSNGKLEYVGFWMRVAASLIDTVLLALAMWPLGALLGRQLQVPYGLWDPLRPAALSMAQVGLGWSPWQWCLQLLVPAAIVVIFWMSRQATPGKMVFGARVVDATTGLPMSVGQALGRYLGYFLSTMFLGLGFVWVGIDSRKQGWHDKLANTIVVRRRLMPSAPPDPSR